MPIKTAVNWLRRFVKYRILHIDDTPHRIALGMGLAIFITWTPAIGLQMVLVLLLCMLFRANKLVGLPFVWISNPATILPIYGPNYLIGCWLLGGDYNFDWGPARALFRHGWWEQINAWWKLTNEIFWPLWLGSLVVGLVLGVATYAFVYHGVVYYRKHRPHLRLKLPLRHRRHRPPQQEPEHPDGDALR